MSNPFSEPGAHGQLLETKPAIPEFNSDCDPGDETDSGNLAEAHARSGTRSAFRAAPLPSGF